jgi:conserved hypothetical protein
MRNFKLRPHHGLCIGFFEGKGYSSDFTRNMAEIIATLKRVDPVIELHSDTDIICRSCPENLGGRCASFEKALNYDKAVLTHCGLENGQLIRWSELSRMIQQKIILCNKRNSICKDCQWNDICDKKVPEY